MVFLLRSTENCRHRCMRRTTGDAVALSGKVKLCCSASNSGELIQGGISSGRRNKDAVTSHMLSMTELYYVNFAIYESFSTLFMFIIC